MANLREQELILELSDRERLTDLHWKKFTRNLIPAVVGTVLAVAGGIFHEHIPAFPIVEGVDVVATLAFAGRSYLHYSDSRYHEDIADEQRVALRQYQRSRTPLK